LITVGPGDVVVPGDAYHERALKYLPNGSCGVVSFGLKDGRGAAEAFMKELELIAIVTHVADARTSILHPASSTHRQLNDEQLAAAGVLPEQMRLSVGIEDISDIVADLSRALDAVR
jgi:O-acetylhomoserine (thiol)-lyase